MRLKTDSSMDDMSSFYPSLTQRLSLSFTGIFERSKTPTLIFPQISLDIHRSTSLSALNFAGERWNSSKPQRS